MERNREARRASTVTPNGLSRRRPRSSSIRDSPAKEDGQMELQEMARLRDRGNKKNTDRDREFSRLNKRRRGSMYAQEANRDGGEGSLGNSVDDEEEEVEQNGRVARTISSNTASSSVSNHNHRRSFLSPKDGRKSPARTISDQMIGVPVPRKARSASTKRVSRDYWTSHSGGFWEDRNHRQLSTSPATRSAAAVSPYSSNASMIKKMKSTGPKNRPPKVCKSSSVIQEDIEIEIAEVLYGLKKQSQSSKKQEILVKSPQKTDSKDTNGIDDQDDKSWVSSPSNSMLGSRRNKLEEDDNSTSFQNSSFSPEIKLDAKMEAYSPKMEKSGFKVESCDDAEMGVSTPLIEENGFLTEKPLPPKDESSSLPSSNSKCDDDLADSTATKAISTGLEVESQRDGKFEIDLMASPPPEKDGCIDLVPDPTLMHQDAEMMVSAVKHEDKVEKLAQKAIVVEGFEQDKMDTIGQSQHFASQSIDLEKQHGDNGSVSESNTQQQRRKQQPFDCTSKVEKIAQPSSLHFPLTVAGWPTGPSHIGCMPHLQTVGSMDTSTGSSTVVQPPHSLLLQPRPKRCATHRYIARSIYYHQQLAKMNQVWPASVGSASLYGAKPNNDVMPSAGNLIPGNSVQGSFLGGNVNSKGQIVATFPGQIGKDKSSEVIVANVMDMAQRKQFVFQQALQPIAAGNLQHGPAYIIPMSQQQTPVSATSFQSGPSKSTISTKNISVPTNSTSGAPATSSAVSFSYPNFSANEAPYMAIVQNNGYSFPISTVGMPSPFKVGTHPQTMPFFNGPFYSSQMFHPSQIQQQQCQPQPLVTSTSSASSSSHKQPTNDRQHGAQHCANNFLTSKSVQFQQQQHKQHVPVPHSSRKIESEMSDSITQKSAYGLNFAYPVQQLNFSLTSNAARSGNGGGGEKQQQKGGADIIPSKAFGMSFAPGNGTSAASSLNFLTMPQNRAILQSQPSGGQSLAFSKPGSTDPSASMIMGSTIFDTSIRTLNFVSSPGNCPGSVSSTVMTTTASPTSQQKQRTPARSKAPTSNSQPSSSMASRFQNDPSVFSQALIQNSHSSQWKNIPQGHTQISFVGNAKSATSSPNNNVGSQQPENSSTGTNQKSSPACRRNVPSILSTGPSQVSELKY